MEKGLGITFSNGSKGVPACGEVGAGAGGDISLRTCHSTSFNIQFLPFSKGRVHDGHSEICQWSCARHAKSVLTTNYH